MFKKIESKGKTKFDNFYSSSKAEIIINESDIDDVFQSIYTIIITNIQKSLGKGSGWTIDSVTDHTISISKYNPLAGSSYIKLPEELDHPRKGLINIQNIDDNECSKWSLVRYLNPADHSPARITKADKEFAKKLDFKDINFQSKLETFAKLKKKKKNSIDTSVLGYENKEKQTIYVSKKCCLLLIEKEGKRQYVLIKGFNIFMYDYSLHRGRKYFCRYCLQAFITEEIFKNHIKDCFKIYGEQIIVMPKKVNMLH